jgi:hypothetical protein
MMKRRAMTSLWGNQACPCGGSKMLGSPSSAVIDLVLLRLYFLIFLKQGDGVEVRNLEK